MAKKPGQTFSAGRVLSKLFVISGFIMKCESELGLYYPYFCFCFNMLHLFICVRLCHRKHVTVNQNSCGGWCSASAMRAKWLNLVVRLG